VEIKGKKASMDFLTRKQSRNEQLYKEEVLPLGQWDEIGTSKILAEMQHQEALENKRLAEKELKPRARHTDEPPSSTPRPSKRWGRWDCLA
jgi:hypothetical protein